MIQFIFRFLSLVFAGIAVWEFIAERMNSSPHSAILGQIWFTASPSSLQIAEAVVERYIDPCSLMLFLGCSPFLWHPGVATILQLPAINVFASLAVAFFIIAQLINKRGRRNYSGLYKKH